MSAITTNTILLNSYTDASNITVTNGGNAYTDTTSTTDATLNPTRGATGTMYWVFNVGDSIPSYATNIKVTAKFKGRVSNTTRITAATIQLYSGTTALGTATSFRSTTSTVYTVAENLSITAAQASGLRLYLSETRNTTNTGTYIYVTGAELTITYDIQDNPEKLGIYTISSNRYTNCFIGVGTNTYATNQPYLQGVTNQERWVLWSYRGKYYLQHYTSKRYIVRNATASSNQAVHLETVATPNNPVGTNATQFTITNIEGGTTAIIPDGVTNLGLNPWNGATGYIGIYNSTDTGSIWRFNLLPIKDVVFAKINNDWKNVIKEKVFCKVGNTWKNLGSNGDIWVKVGTKWLSIYGDYNVDVVVDPIIDPTTGEPSKIKEEYEPQGETFSGMIHLTHGALNATGNEKDYIKVVIDITGCSSDGTNVWEEIISVAASSANLSDWNYGCHVYFNNNGNGTDFMHNLRGQCICVENGSANLRNQVGSLNVENNQIIFIVNSTGIHVYADEACTTDLAAQYPISLATAGLTNITDIYIGSTEGVGRSHAKFVSIEYNYYETKQ